VPVFGKEGAIIAKRRNEAGTSFALRVGTGDLGQYAVLGMNNDFGDGTGVNFVMTAGQLVAGRWHHLAATYDGQTASIFIDGNLASSEKIAMRLRPSSFPLTIGQENLPGDPRAFLGLIDEVRVWNRALGEQELRARMSMQLTGEEPGLVGYWNFDDQTAKDRSPYQNHGELIGAARLVEDPLIFLEIRRAVEIIATSGSSTSTYQLQFKPDATADEWTNLGEPFTGGEPVQFFDSTTSGQKLYRAIRIQ
jgi:hypothetical protein